MAPTGDDKLETTTLTGTTIMNNTPGQSQAPRKNAYERARTSNNPPKPWQRAFTRDQLLGGTKSHELSAYLRQYVPSRTSRFHETIQTDSGSCDRFMASVGFAKAGPSWGPTLYARPGQAVPDVFTCGGSYLYWSTTPLPGTLAVVAVQIEGAGSVDLYVADVVSMTLACLFNGSEQAMLEDHLAEG